MKNNICSYSLVRYLEKCFTQIFKALYGNNMLVPFGGTSTKRLYSNKKICHCV